MPDTLTRLTLFMPGTPSSVAAWNAALTPGKLSIEGDVLRGQGLASKVDVEWVPNDGVFGEAFSFGTITPQAVQLIDDVPGALVLSWPVDLKDGRQEITGVVERLGHAGALAVRVEESKLGWETTRWLSFLTADDPWGWHRAAVTFLRNDEAMQSCGMHAFSLPDVRVEVDAGANADDLQHLASVLNVYQIEENPLTLSGHTFSPDADTPRRVVERWPDTQYPPDHACHNPYGVWRLGPPGGKARPQDELALVFIPALRVLLAGLEARADRPFTQQEVEDVRDKGACMAMDHRDAQQLERSRGYADLDPDLAWEQWQLVRKHRG